MMILFCLAWIFGPFASATALHSPCVNQFHKQTCLRELGADPREIRVPIVEIPASVSKFTMDIKRAAVIDETAKDGGRFLLLQSFSSKELAKLVKSSSELNGPESQCVFLNKAQSEQFDLETRTLGTARVVMESVETSRKNAIPTVDEIQRGTVLKINRRRFVVLQKIWITNDYPRLLMDEIPGFADPGIETTGHRFTFDYNGKFFYENNQTIFRILREGEVELQDIPNVTPGVKYRIGPWITRSADEKVLYIGKMTYLHFQPAADAK